MKTVILAGGMGTRLQEETATKPKPMVEIGGRPILWHIMKVYAAHQFTEFVVALGYRGELIKDYFLSYYLRSGDLSVHLREGRVDVHKAPHEDWTVHLVDTGLETQTGGRLKRLGPQIGGETFMMTYGDGVANIDLRELVAFHRAQGKLATVTAVRPPARFGGITIDGPSVSRFVEKPQLGEGWINGGYFVLEPGVLDYISGDESIWEHEPMQRLVEEEQLVAFRLEGFWQGMDTLRDVRLLESMWASGEAPWRIWQE